ncbi:MAG: D-3-phosphoglycerate dehydrogenase [Flavobacteriaceae bacterium]|jgi:D-3-phosphoglycerate dehydrogenase
MKVLHIDVNHPALIAGLKALGYENHEDYSSTKQEIMNKIGLYEGLILRSRFPIDAVFLKAAAHLKFIGRLGAGLENIDLAAAKKYDIFLAAAPEGNRNAVGEHSLSLLLALLNKIHTADRDVKKGIWDREGNRGVELDGQTVGIIGFGNMGQAFAKKLKGFNLEIIYHDLLTTVAIEGATQVPLKELQERATVLSLHLPQTSDTIGLVNSAFLNGFKNPIWLLNTGRGSSVVTEDLVTAIKNGKVLGAGLDVLEYEKSSFEGFLNSPQRPKALDFICQSDQVVLSPHVGGWTRESHEKLALTIVDKIALKFG